MCTPRGHLVVAAIYRIGEVALLRILQEQAEKVAKVWRKADLAVRDQLQHLILARRVELCKVLAFLLTTPSFN